MVRFVFRLAKPRRAVPGGDCRNDGSDCVRFSLQIAPYAAAACLGGAEPCTTLVRLRAVIEQQLGATAWQMLEAWLLPQPAFAVLFALALVFLMAGYKKPSPAGRFAV